MNLRMLRSAGAFALVAATGGCYVESTPYRNRPDPPPPPPQTVVESAPPAPPPPQTEVVVEDPPPPPPPQVEPAPPPPPAPGNIWVNGNYRWENNRYTWERGHYERPPRPNARYVSGHWEARARGRAWVGSHWE